MAAGNRTMSAGRKYPSIARPKSATVGACAQYRIASLSKRMQVQPAYNDCFGRVKLADAAMCGKGNRTKLTKHTHSLSLIARTSAPLHGVLNCGAFVTGPLALGQAKVGIARSTRFQYFIILPVSFYVLDTFYMNGKDRKSVV